METAEIRQCWAFHRDGYRCEHPAGHPGDHTISQTWTDLQCATPGEFTPAPATPVADISRAVSAPPAVVTSCIACSHKHKGGECKCGCYEFIG